MAVVETNLTVSDSGGDFNSTRQWLMVYRH